MLIVALAAPAVAALAFLAAPRTATSGSAVRAVAAATVPLWAVMAAGTEVEHAGRFSGRPAAAAAACAIAALVAASKPTERTTADVVVVLVTWSAATLAVTAAVGDASTLPLAVGLAVAAVATTSTTTADKPFTSAIVMAGAALVVGGWATAGEAAAHFAGDAFAASPVGTALALAGVAAILFGALDGDGPIVLAAPALAAAVVVAPTAAGSPAAVVVPVAGAAIVAAWFDRRPLVLALLAVAALAVDTPTGLLAAGAAVVAAAVPSSLALLATAPAAAALATTTTHDPTIASVALAAAAAITAVFLTAGRDLRPTTIPLRSLPAAAIGAHLTVAAASWTWTTPGRDATDALRHWNRGAGLAAAAATLAVATSALLGRVDLAAGPAADLDAATDAEPGLATAPADPARATRAVTVALALLGLATAALVRSSLRSV